MGKGNTMSDVTKEKGAAAYGMVAGTSALCDMTGKTNSVLDGICAGIQAVLKLNQQIETGGEDGTDFIDEVNRCETQDDLRCTRHACVRCTNAAPPSSTVHLVKDECRVLIGNIGQLNKWDIELEGQFAGCRAASAAARKNVTEANTCVVKKEDIEGGRWQDVDELNDEGEGMETVNMESSYMICTKYGGLIYFDDDGQDVLNHLDEAFQEAEIFIWRDISAQGIEIIKQFELSDSIIQSWGLGEYENGNLIGVYPYYVFKKVDGVYKSDGGITFGYGHYVADVTDEYDRELMEQYAPDADFAPPYIPENGLSYRVPGSSYIPMELAEEIYRRDLDEGIMALNNFLKINNIRLTQYQFDALVSFTHNYGGDWWWRDKLMPNFIREGHGTYDPDEVMEFFLEHDNKSRRRVEAELFNYGYGLDGD